MIILDKPYISELLQETIIKNNYTVLDTDNINLLNIKKEIQIISTQEAITTAKNDPNNLIYCNSENSINWINKNLSFTPLPEMINTFKDKIKFRKILKEIYPDFYFEEIEFKNIDALVSKNLKYPFIIKPSVGFLSIGVHVVEKEEELKKTIELIKKEISETRDLFPTEVVDSSMFIIEEIIQGEEYAIDAYYTKNGEPVILNILKHPFSSSKDVSDRVYYTSKQIITDQIEKVTHLLREISKLTDIKNFPLHLEVRISNNEIVPIEINPMRFAGWCCTDLAYFAYGINIYEYFMEQRTPDWQEIFNRIEDSSYFYFNIAEVPASIDKNTNYEFDYDGFTSNFNCLLEGRKIDFKTNPLFGIFFAKTDNYAEIEKMLIMDLSRFIKTK